MISYQSTAPAARFTRGEVTTAPSEVVQGLLENKAAAKRSRTYKNFTQIMTWCAKAAKMQVRTNADSPDQVKNAIAFGATGVGLMPNRAHVLRGRPASTPYAK